MLRKIIPISLFVISGCSGGKFSADIPLEFESDSGIDGSSIDENNTGSQNVVSNGNSNNTNSYPNMDGGVDVNNQVIKNEEVDSGKNEPDVKIPEMDSGNTEPDSGGNSSSDSNGTNNNCQPKNCIDVVLESGKNPTQNKACNVIEDGCGGYLDCGNCDSYISSFNDDTIKCKNNICQDTCYYSQDISNVCDNRQFIICPSNSEPPQENCDLHGNLGQTSWCCN